MIGYKNEFFEVVESAGRNPKKRYKLWKCRCKCGNYTILDTCSIKKKHIKSCGCSRKGNNKGNNYGFKHGYSRHPVYRVRNRILSRCYNAKKHEYPYYQGKGIKVCEEWIHNVKSFIDWAFNAGWRPGLCIDRIDPEGNYEPNNCRFITITENSRRKNKNNKKIKKDPIKYCYKCKCTGDSDAPCKYKKTK